MAGSKIGDAFIAVSADVSQINSSLKTIDDNVSKAASGVEKISGSMKAVGAAAGTFLAEKALGALSGIGAAIEENIQQFINLNESQNAVRVTFGDVADEVAEMGERSATSLGLATSEFNALAVQSSAFVKTIAEGAGKTVPEVLGDLTTRAADFASVMNLDVNDALAKFQSGLAGEGEPLKQFGIDISAGVIEQKALELGLADTTSELTEQDKVLARYEAIMDQTNQTAGDFANTSDQLANKLRIQEAQLKNNQAAAGAALAPFKELQSEVGLLGSQALGILATGFQQMTGDISAAESAIGQFNILTGASADSLEALVTINQETGIGFQELADAMGLASDETLPLTESQKDFLRQIGFTEDKIKELDDVLAGEHADALANDALAVGDNRYDEMQGDADNATDAIDDNTDALQANIDKLEAHQDKIRAGTDPIFALFAANRDLAGAEADLEATRADAESTVDDITEAELARLEALRDVSEAEADARVQTDLTRDQLIQQAEIWGLDAEAAQELIDKILEYNRTEIPPKEAEIILRARDETGHRFDSGFQEFAQHGGQFEAGTPVIVGEAGRELFVPEVNGQIIPHPETEAILAGSGTGTPLGGGVNITQNFFTEPTPTPTTQRAMQEAAAVIGFTR